MKKIIVLFFVLALALTLGFTATTATAAAADTCPNTGGDWVKVDDLSGLSYSYTAPSGYLVAEWCYKASTTVVYGNVNPPQKSVTVSSTVLNPAGNNYQELSHASFRLVKSADPQWCSPGYWRNHLGAWGPTGYSPNDSFYLAIGYYPKLSQQGIRSGATTNPTLGYVLKYPQYYGGGAFNDVGDLLSSAHPGVNFTGIRVQDSCPLK